jgi:tetratricopeptide (TPR) repeat protein
MSRDVKLYFPNDRIKALLLIFLVGLVFLPFIGNPLIFDDLPFFAGALGFADEPFSLNLRWFPYVSIGITSVFAGGEPPVFHLQNLLLHGFNVLLLLLLMRLWISILAADANKAKVANWGAWLGALIFAIHPLAVYGVGYLVQRSILMATLFALIMQLAYLRGLLENKKRYMALAVAAYFLAVFSKEHSIMAPAILLPLTWLLRERIRFSPRVLLATWGGFFVVAVLVMARIKGLLGVAYEPDAASMFGQQEMLQGLATPHLLSVLTQAGLFFKYLLLMLVPNPAWMSIDMRETFLLSYREWTNWLGLVAFVSYGLVALWSVLRGGRVALLGLALLYPWLLFMTEFSSVRVQESFVLYRAYLWMPGVMLLLPLLVISLPDKKIMWAGALVVALLVPLSWNRLWVMGDNYRLWDDAVKLLHGEDRLGSQRTYYNRALYASQLNNWDGAIADYQKSLAIDSSHSQVFIALASAYYGAKRYDDALSALEQVIGKDAKNAQAHYSKSMVLRAMGDKVGGLQSLETSCRLGNEMGCMLINYAKQQKN